MALGGCEHERGLPERLVPSVDVGSLEQQRLDRLHLAGASRGHEDRLAFRQHGDTIEARRLLKTAKKTNKHVPAYLLGQKFPPSEPPDSYSPGQTVPLKVKRGSRTLTIRLTLEPRPKTLPGG